MRDKKRFNQLRKSLDKWVGNSSVVLLWCLISHTPWLSTPCRQQNSQKMPVNQTSSIPPLHLLDDEELTSLLADMEALLGGDCEQSDSGNPARTTDAGKAVLHENVSSNISVVLWFVGTRLLATCMKASVALHVHVYIHNIGEYLTLYQPHETMYWSIVPIVLNPPYKFLLAYGETMMHMCITGW